VKKILILISLLVMMLVNVCWAEKYSLSDDQQKFLMAVLSQVQIRGSDAPMIMQCAQALSQPIKEVPKDIPPEVKN